MPISAVVHQITRGKQTEMARRMAEYNESSHNKIIISNLQDILKLGISVTLNITSMMIGHGKTKSYHHRFKIVYSPLCPCDNREQSLDNILFTCDMLQKQR